MSQGAWPRNDCWWRASTFLLFALRVAHEYERPARLEPILDAIRKDRTSLNANIDKLIAWAQTQEKVVKNAQANAREAALRQIREAAASIHKEGVSPVRAARSPGSPPQRELSAREQLDARLAQGAIDTEEYHERLEALSGHRPGI